MVRLFEYIAKCEDPFDFIYECLMGRHGPDAEQTILEVYNDVSADYCLHPDDEFERIINIMVEQLEKDYA